MVYAATQTNGYQKRWFVMGRLRALHGMDVYKNANGCTIARDSVLEHLRHSCHKLLD